ncbi:DUF4468 domain-containing protein [Spirosoma validum]|nr:DUF4468 domain-containing protein [Spirosoma validum]
MITLLLTLLVSALFVMGSVNANYPSIETDDRLQTILPIINQKVTYSDVVDCGSVSQLDLFRRARLWVVQSGHSIDAPFLLSDKETGDLAGRFSQTITIPRSENAAGGIYTFRYNYVIECANRKYRAVLTQIELDEGNGRYTPIETLCQKNEKNLPSICQELDRQLNNLLGSLQESMKNYKAF